MGRLAALNTLREKLGEDGVNALFEVLEEERERTRDYLFRLLEERFARRLAEEIGKLRSEMYKLFAQHSAEVDEKIEGLRSEMHDEIGKLRSEMTEKIENLRSEMHDEIGKLRAEMAEKIEILRSEMYEQMGRLKADIIKWMFIFLVSQTIAIISVIVAIMRFLR